LATLKENMATIVENQVENRVNNTLPILIQSIKGWIAGGRQGPHPKYQGSTEASSSGEPSDPATSASHVVSDPVEPAFKKNGRNTPKKKDYVACKINRVVDKINMKDRQYHVAGEPTLLLEKYLMVPGDMKSLHDLILKE
jgi:hypothetical protein